MRAILAVAVLVPSQVARGGAVLGPVDGVGLPPTDLERVRVGGPAPDFTLESRDGQLVTLSGFQAKKNVVLVFYRGYW